MPYYSTLVYYWTCSGNEKLYIQNRIISLIFNKSLYSFSNQSFFLYMNMECPIVYVNHNIFHEINILIRFKISFISKKMNFIILVLSWIDGNQNFQRKTKKITYISSQEFLSEFNVNILSQILCAIN